MKYGPGLRSQRSGYTIIEVMIFFAVSAILFGSVYATFSLQSRRGEFTEGVRKIETSVRDVLNDVETGFYPASRDFRCVVDPGTGALTLAPATGGAADQEQGGKQDCVFLGRAFQFNPLNGGGPVSFNSYNVYTIAGKRLNAQPSATNSEITNTVISVEDADPTAITEGVDGIAFDTRPTNTSVGVTRIFNPAGSAPFEDMGGFVVLSGFGPSDATGSKTGTIRTTLISLQSYGGAPPRAELNDSTGTYSTVDFVNRLERIESPHTLPDGVVICLREDPVAVSGRRASITIGGDVSGPTTFVDFDNSANAGCP